MARSFKICVQDDKGRPIACAWCRAFRNDTQAEVETQYTDGSGNATFTSLPDNTDCYIIALWGVQSKFFFSEATIGNTEISDVSISKLTVGNLDVVGTLTSNGKFVTAASPNPRIEITQTLIAGYSDATTKQFYLQASDGKAYFGGGACILDSEGLTIKGQKIIFAHTDSAGIARIYSNVDYDLVIDSYSGVIKIDTIRQTGGGNVMGTITPYGTSNLGESGNKWNSGYFTNLPACPVPTSNSALGVIKKIEAPQIMQDDRYGERHYFKDKDFPPEMKCKKTHIDNKGNVIEEEEEEIEFIRTIGILVQAARELTQRIESLEKGKA